jgi:hypothetical protein
MPQASDYPTLYQIETAIETAVSTLLTAQSITHHISRATTAKTAPHVDVQASLGEVTGRFFTDNDGTLRDASFNFTLAFRVVTNRHDDSTTHRDYRAKIRNVFAQYVADLNAELTYHAVAELHHVESTPEIQDEDDLDVSAMQYAGVVDIKNDSWPAATP